jgi:CRISPR-associated protein Cmr1
MDSVEFDIEIVTPMFLGGANTTDAELRVPSIKGMLRFWWRATCGIENFKEMKKEETKIFGSTDQKASFSMKLEGLNNIKAIKSNLSPGKKFQPKGKTFSVGIIDYLAFGIRDHRNGYVREHFPSGSQFKLIFFFYNSENKQSILNAFYSFIDNGGLGAKSRNGFGSLCITENHKSSMQFKGNLQKYSALSSNSKLFNGLSGYDRWEDTLSEIGMAYKDARLSVEKKHNYDKRLLIAKPIVQSGNSKERHAKPYFLHIKKNINGKFQGQILFMPYQYYQSEKHNEYMQVCQKVNAKLSKLLKVQK